MRNAPRVFSGLAWALAAILTVAAPTVGAAQTREILPVDIAPGRSYPITTLSPITRASIANPDIADVVVVAANEVVINAKASGETDALVYLANGTRQHYRVNVRAAVDRRQIALAVKFAEVRRDRLRQFGLSYFYNGAQTRPGTGVYRPGSNYAEYPGRDLRPGFDSIVVQTGQLFTNVLSNLGSSEFQAFLDAETQRGDARILAEPTILAGNRDTANFLAGGELPIPIAQGTGTGGNTQITILFKEFGVRLRFVGEVLSDELIKLAVRPEVSSLDYGNAVTIQGFRVPAFRTRRVESTIDVRRNESIIISGLFNEEREKVRTGIPLLSDIPILGALFSSSRFLNNESELLVIVRPVLVDPMQSQLGTQPGNRLQVKPDTTLPARPGIEKRLDQPARGGPTQQPARPPR